MIYYTCVILNHINNIEIKVILRQKGGSLSFIETKLSFVVLPWLHVHNEMSFIVQ